MTNSFTLGKDGSFGNIDFNKLRSGITKKDLGIEANTVLSNIFDSIDNGGEEGGESKGNGRLERNELQAFINKIKELAGNDKLSKREAKNYEIDGEKLGKNKEELVVFLNKLAELTKGVKQITVGNGTEIVTFEDGHTEQILANGNKIITRKQDGKTVTTTVDGDDNVLEETEEDDNFITTTKNNPNTHKKQEVTTKNKNNNATVITQYEDDGETPKSKEEVTGDTIRKFKYNKDTQKYVPVSEDIRYSGTKRVEHTEYDQEKSTEEQRVPKYTTVTEDGKLVSKTVGNKTVEYDGNGNTYVIVQQDERDAGKIAQKFGCSKEKLVEVNGNRVFFNVGEKVKVPRQIEPDAPELENRLSSEEAIKKFEEEQEAKRKAEEAARAARERARAEAERARQTGSTGGSTGTEQPRTRTETRKKYDTATIQKEAGQLATALHNQISGASLNAKTIGLLRTLTNDNVAFVVTEYQNRYGVSLAKDIDDEWGLDINTVKEHICKKLVDQAKSLGINGIYYGDYQKINDVNQLQNWINNAAAKIRNAMANATETYTVKEGEKPPMTHGEKQVQKQSAQQIVNDLIDATSLWNDHDAIRKALNKIDNPEEYKEVERLLALEGYSSDKMYSSLEKFIKEELQRIATDYTSEDLEKYVQKWINSGVIKGGAAISAQARMAARVIVDAGDGFGTDVEKTKKGIYMIKAPAGQGKAAAKKVYDQVNSIIASHRTFYGIGTRSKGLMDYLKGEVWDSEIKYLKGILGENDAIQGKEKAQAVADLTEEAVSGAGTDIEYLKQAIKAINSPEDRKAVEAKLKEYCKKKGINIQLKGQAALQAILYDECDTFMGLHRDHKEIRKFNEMLISQGAYTEEEAINLRAEQAVLQILEGDYNNVMDAVAQVKDPKVLAKIDSYLQNNIIKGQKYASLQDFLNKKFGTNSVNSDLVMAELAGNNLVGDEKAADVAFRLINNSDFNKRAMGLKAIRSEKTARLVDAKLREKGSSLEQVYNQFNKEKAEYKTKSAIWDGLAFILGDIAEHISDEYRKNTDSSDNIYVEAASAKEIPPEKLQAYLTAIEAFEQNLEKMKADYQEALDSQGVVSGAINAFCSRYNIGTTRDEIEARIEHDTETLRLLKLAAKGKLSKMVNGKTVSVSFEEVFKERQSAFVSGNGASLSSISNTIKPKEVTEFDAAKVEKVAKKAETIGAMEAVKNLVAVCWDELDSANESNDKKQFAAAIYDTLGKLSQLSGKKLSLADYGYKLNDAGIIVDSKGNEVPVNKLKEIIAKLKQGLSDISKNVLGQSLPLNADVDEISELLEDAYDNKMEAFKQEYKDAFGQDAPDSVIESYVSTINTGKTIVNFGAIIGAAVLAPFTGGGSLAVFGAVAGVSMGLNALEKSTDADGYTNMEWTSDAEQALWDGALAAIGMKIGKYGEAYAKVMKYDKALFSKLLSKNIGYLSKFIKDPKKLKQAAEMLTKIEANGYKITAKAAEKMSPKNAKIVSKYVTDPEAYEKAMIWVGRFEAAGIEISSDGLQNYLQIYCQNGEFDEDQFVTAMLMSVGFNIAGHAWSARGDIKQGQKALDAPSREALPPPSEAKPHETPQQPKQIGSDGQNPHHVDGDADAGKVGDAPKEEPKANEPNIDEPKVSEPKANESKVDEPKSYSEMNENELFAEYQRLNNEFKYGCLSNSEKVVNINKMKEISKVLDAKGYSIEAGELKSKSKSNPAKTEKKSAQDLDATKKTKTKIQEELNDVSEADVPKQDPISKQTRINQLGQTLANVFDMWVEKIQNINISNLVEIPLWVKNIKKQFKKFPEYENELLGYLKKQVNSISDLSSDIIIDATKGISSAGSKLTKKLAKLQDKIIEAIDDLVDVKHFNKIAKSINKHFSDIEDVFNNLWDKLMAKARQLDLDLETNLIKKKVKTPYDNLQPQNTNYLKNIANKHHAKIVDVNINTAHFKRGDSFVIDLATNKNAQILLGPIMSIDLSEPRLAKLLLNLKEGQSFTIGSFEGHATYRMGSSANGVSHEHLIVTKKNGVYIFKDTSTYGTHVSKNSAEPIKSKEVKDMFWGNHTKGSYYMGKVHNGGISLDSEDYKNIAKLMNKCNGKYRKLWESTFLIDNGRNIDKLAAFENLIRRHGTLEYYLNMDDRTWAVVVENICQKHESAVNAIHNYKASSSSINQSLSAHKAFSQETASMINNMTDYLNTQTINKRIKVYRGEQYNGSLSLLKFPNGMSVGQAMENLIRKGASQQEINSFVNKYLIGSSFKQERFMSTALNRDFCADWAKSNAMGHSGPNPYGSVVWEIDVPGETKGAFVEDFNTFYGEEYEVILQRESSLIIKGAYYDKNKNQWIIQATVQQTPYENIPRY